MEFEVEHNTDKSYHATIVFVNQTVNIFHPECEICAIFPLHSMLRKLKFSF